MYRKVFGVYGTLTPMVQLTIGHILANQANRAIWFVPRKQPEVFEKDKELGRLEVITANTKSDVSLGPVLGQLKIENIVLDGVAIFSHYEDRIKHLALILGFQMKANARFVAVSNHLLNEEAIGDINSSLIGREIPRNFANIDRRSLVLDVLVCHGEPDPEAVAKCIVHQLRDKGPAVMEVL